MEKTELQRYDRQIILPEIGVSGQHKLKKAAVLIVGAGGLGCPVALYLAAAGVGRIGIADHDVVAESNLHRQVLYHVSDIGKNKACVAAEKLKLLNPYTEIKVYSDQVNDANAKVIIDKYDLVVDASDNFSTRYLVNDTCVLSGKPLMFGSIQQFEGQVSLFNAKGGPNYRDLYTEPPVDEDLNDCGRSGVVGTLPAIIGSIMANEVLKVICGFGETLSGRLLLFNALNNETQILMFGNADVKEDKETDQKKPYILSEIMLRQLKEWDDGQVTYLLIDLREAYEYEEYNIGGINIPLYELNVRDERLLSNQKLVFACRSGKRSQIAAHLLKNHYSGELYTFLIPF